jgi:hypothetical protein
MVTSATGMVRADRGATVTAYDPVAMDENLERLVDAHAACGGEDELKV